MLKLTIPGIEIFDEINEEFTNVRERKIQLKHSLVSITKWEAKWKKPFLDKDPKTYEESVDYIRCMTITQNVPDDAYRMLTTENLREVNSYIEDSMTATVISQVKKKANQEVITSELIYYWLIALAIPFECQKWHLNKLLTLIGVCNIKNQPEKKMGRQELANRNRAINEARKKELNTKG